MYKVSFAKTAIKTLEKLDKYTKRIIIEWIEKNLDGCENPRIFGKPLSANRKGQWRYRVGDYRILTDIRDNELIILVINVGHRRDIYNS